MRNGSDKSGVSGELENYKDRQLMEKKYVAAYYILLYIFNSNATWHKASMM